MHNEITHKLAKIKISTLDDVNDSLPEENMVLNSEDIDKIYKIFLQLDQDFKPDEWEKIIVSDSESDE